MILTQVRAVLHREGVRGHGTGRDIKRATVLFLKRGVFLLAFAFTLNYLDNKSLKWPFSCVQYEQILAISNGST